MAHLAGFGSRACGLRAGNGCRGAVPCQAPMAAGATQRGASVVVCAASHPSIPEDEQPRQPPQLPNQPLSSGSMQGFPAQFWSLEPKQNSWDLVPWDSDDDVSVPAPANLPADLPGGELLFPPSRESLFSRFGQWSLTDQPGVDLLLAGPVLLNGLRQVYVILFGVGERDTEGIYSLRAFGEDGLPQETIIVFEAEEDAQRYAGLLEATMDHQPNVCSIPPAELIEFCEDQGYRCRMEPRGSLLIPPDYNVGVTDWERSMRLRDGRWAVLDSEPEVAGVSKALESTSSSSSGGRQTAITTAAPHAVRPTSLANAAAASSSSSALARYHPSFSQEELDHIRAQLERLLPPSDASSSSSLDSTNWAPGSGPQSPRPYGGSSSDASLQ